MSFPRRQRCGVHAGAQAGRLHAHAAHVARPGAPCATRSSAPLSCRLLTPPLPPALPAPPPPSPGRSMSRLVPPPFLTPCPASSLLPGRSMSRGRALSLAPADASTGLKDASQRNKAIKMAGERRWWFWCSPLSILVVCVRLVCSLPVLLLLVPSPGRPCAVHVRLVCSSRLCAPSRPA